MLCLQHCFFKYFNHYPTASGQQVSLLRGYNVKDFNLILEQKLRKMHFLIMFKAGLFFW